MAGTSGPPCRKEHIIISPTLRARLGVLFTVVAWGASFTAVKTALAVCSPLSVIWVRFTIGTAILGLLTFCRKDRALPRGRSWGLLALLGFLSVPFHNLLQATGLRTAEAASSAWIVATSPAWVALLGWLFLKESLGLRGVLGMILAAGGVLLVVFRHRGLPVPVADALSLGNLLVLASAVNWAVFSVLSRQALQRFSPLWTTTWMMGLGWVMTTALYLPSGLWRELASLPPAVWRALAFLGVFCTGFGYAFWYEGLRHLPAAQVGSFLFLNPLSATGVAAAVLGEPLSWALAGGGALVLAGVTLVNRRAPAR